MINSNLCNFGNNTISLDEYRKKTASVKTNNVPVVAKNNNQIDQFVFYNPNQKTSNLNSFLKKPFVRAVIDFVAKVLIIAASSVVAGMFFTKYSQKLAQKASNQTNQLVANVWQDVAKAPTLKELALPKILDETVDKVLYKINNQTEYIEKGGSGINSILLYGPPGTGKTTFSKAISKAIPNSRFASIDLSAIEGKYVGDTQGNLNKMVDEVCNFAKSNPDKKVVVLLDEIDSFALENTASSNQDYHSKVLNALKTALSDKLGQQKNIITIAATNVDIDSKSTTDVKLSAPILDRFGEKIKIENPTSSQFQRAIANHYSNKTKVASYLKEADSKEVIEISKKLEEKKYSFRKLQTLFDNAALINQESPKVTFREIMNAIEKIAQNEGNIEKRAMGFQARV